MMTKLDDYLQDAKAAAARSHALWRPVNRSIVRVLEEALRCGHSKKRVCATLMKMAGPKRRGEAVAVENYRSAARQIASGVDRLTLL